MYIYQRISGELYVSDKYLTLEEREYGGSCDWLIGKADSRESAWKLLKPKCKKNHGITKDAVKKFLEENWND